MNAARTCGAGTPSGVRGLVLLALLITLLLASIGLMVALDVWALQKQRLREEELLFVGEQYRLAIQRYYEVGHSLPASVDDLLNDQRFPQPLHHLRRAYPDPVTGKNDWLFLRLNDRIFGIYSSSTATTIKRANFPRRYAAFAGAKTYGEWQFVYMPPAPQNAVMSGLPPAPSKTPFTFQSGQSGQFGPSSNPAPLAPFGQRAPAMR